MESVVNMPALFLHLLLFFDPFHYANQDGDVVRCWEYDGEIRELRVTQRDRERIFEEGQYIYLYHSNCYCRAIHANLSK